MADLKYHIGETKRLTVRVANQIGEPASFPGAPMHVFIGDFPSIVCIQESDLSFVIELSPLTMPDISRGPKTAFMWIRQVSDEWFYAGEFKFDAVFAGWRNE